MSANRPLGMWKLISHPLTLIAACGLAVAGCDRGDQTSAAIRAASLELEAVAPVDGRTGEELKSQTYRSVLSDLEGVTATGGQGASISVLMSKAERGLGEIPAAKAAEGEREVRRQAAYVRAVLNQWKGASADAAAYEAFDSTETFAELQRGIDAAEADVAQQRAEKAEIDREIALLRNKAADKLAQARESRARETELRTRAMNVSATEAAALVTSAREHQRTADAFEVEAADLNAQADIIEPRSAEKQLRIEKAESQRDLLGKAYDAEVARGEYMKAQAGKARARAAAAADKLEEAVATLDALRGGAAVAEADDAVRHFTNAVRHAQKAKSELRATAQLAAGDAHLAIAEVELSRYHGLSAYHGILSSLGSTSSLPGGSQYANAASTADTQREASKQALIEAIQSATSAFESSGARGEAKDRLDRARTILGDAVYDLSDGSVDIRPSEPVNEPASDRPRSAPSESSASAGGPAETLEVLGRMAEARQFSGMAQYFTAGDPAMDGAIRSALGAVQAVSDLDNACQNQFGADLMTVYTRSNGAMAGFLGAGQMQGIDEAGDLFASLDPSMMEIEVNGDTATVRVPDEVQFPGAGGGAASDEPMRMKRVNGTWLIDLSEPIRQSASDPQMTQQFIALVTQVQGALQGVSTQMAQGAFPNEASLVMALDQAMAPVFQTIMAIMGQGMQGGN